jgi:CRISPR-associated protein Csb2
MTTFLVLSIRLHDGRYHGAGNWPPAPARLFQALIAGSGISGPLPPDHLKALEWMETVCAPPIIAAPRAALGQSVGNFVPNNDLDAKGGDPRNIGAIRTKKQIRPRIFEATTPFHYAWEIPAGEESSDQSVVLQQLADRVYQFGRGVDFAWATAELMSEKDLDSLLNGYAGTVHRPTPLGSNGLALACPEKGSLSSLERRYAANAERFDLIQSGRVFSQSFRQQPKARFRLVAYDSPPARRIFDLREPEALERFSPWPLSGVYQLVKLSRDLAGQKMTTAFPAQEADVQRWLIGRQANGSNGGSPAERIRLIPIPSIGHEHADMRVRRLLVEIPGACPFAPEDVFWAFSGLRIEADKGGPLLAPSSGPDMLKYYSAEKGATVWRSVTPIAVPESAGRRRIEPSRRSAEAKPASEKRAEQNRAAHAVIVALRHADVRSPVAQIAVQREPFNGSGERVEAFAAGSRFAKERLWHVEITFTEPHLGPLIVGDGRFSGLGILIPVS